MATRRKQPQVPVLDHCLIVTADTGQWTVDSRNVIMFGAAVREGGLLPPGPHHSQCDLHQVGALVQGNPGSAAKAGTQPSPAQPSPAQPA